MGAAQPIGQGAGPVGNNANNHDDGDDHVYLYAHRRTDTEFYRNDVLGCATNTVSPLESANAFNGKDWSQQLQQATAALREAGALLMTIARENQLYSRPTKRPPRSGSSNYNSPQYNGAGGGGSFYAHPSQTFNIPPPSSHGGGPRGGGRHHNANRGGHHNNNNNNSNSNNNNNNNQLFNNPNNNPFYTNSNSFAGPTQAAGGHG